MSEEDEAVSEEIRIPEQRGLLGGQSTYATQYGVRTLHRVALCDRCHRPLGEDYVYCVCQRKVCSRCSVFYEVESVYYCIDCVQLRLPLTKKEYLILSGYTRLSKRKEISKVARIRSGEAKAIVRRLARAGLLGRKGIPLFSPYQPTQEGEEALAIFRQVYGQHPDVVTFSTRLMEKELEKSGV